MLRRRNPRFYKRELRDILKMVFTAKVVEGEYIKLFEKKFAEYIGTKFAIATCAGRNGLDLLLDTLDLNEKDEILVPAYTLKDLIYLIRAKGLEPKLIDIERDTFNINPDLIEEKITDRTKVILATHIFGLPCNMERILDIAKKHNLKVIEDCAHAAGAEYKNRKVGSLGDAAFFSFETTKPINTFGGGIITTDDQRVASVVRQKIKSYPVGGWGIVNKILFTYLEHLIIRSPFYPLLISSFMFKSTTKIMSNLYLFLHNRARVSYSRFTNIQALIGLAQLNQLDEKNEKRNRLAYRLTEMLDKSILSQKAEIDTKRIFYMYIVRLPIKEGIGKVRGEILRKGIDAGIKGEITDDCSKIISEKDCPIVKQVYNSALQLPMYDQLTERNIDYIAKIANDWVLRRKG